MKNDIRSSGIGIVGNIPWGTHFSQFYQTKEDLFEIIIPYFKAGLENNEFCMWITSQPLLAEDAKDALRKAISDFDVYLETGQIEIIPYNHWCVKDGVFDSDRVLNGWVEKLNQALANEYNGLRVVESTFWLGKENWSYFADYEEKLDSLINSHQMIILHPYCLDILDGTETTDLISSHQISLIKKKGKWKRIENPIKKDKTGYKLAEESFDQVREKIQAKSENLKETNKALREIGERLQITATNSPDIIERKDAEEILQKILQRFYMILSNMHDSILLVSEKGLIEFANDIFCQYFNLNEQPVDLVGITASEMIRKIYSSYNDPERAVARIKEIVEKWEPVIGEEVELTGGRTCIRDFIPLFIDGEPYGRLWCHVDITERKKAEKVLKKAHDTLEEKVKERTKELEKAYESLKESEESLAEAQKMAHIGNWKWDIRTDEIHCSDEVYRIFGLKPQFGVTFDAYFNYVHPDDSDLIVNTAKEVLKGKPASIDNRIITANGEERIIHSDAEIIFDENNIPVYAKGIVQDVTERRQAEKMLQENEARFRNLFETIPSGVIIYDVIDEGSDFIFKDINPAGERIIQVRKEDIIGKSLYEFFPNVSEMGLDEVFRRVWLTGRPEFFPVTLYKDERIALWVTNHVYRLPSGELVAVFDDITERKKAEESLERTEIARKQEIHHRIKNNLQVISSLLDLQAGQFRNKECIKNYEVLEAFRESQDRVISMALIHEELYKGGGFETLNLAPYIAELTQNLFQTYNLGNSNISLNIDLAESTFFDMDIAVPLGMIVNELVSNSLKYAFIGRDKGEIRIRLVREESLLKNQDCESTIFTLTVSDNGVGILENIEIKKLDSLGMQLVTSLVDQLDGELELKRDNGTEFIIKFTVKEV